jgi:SAM-dependent methyltransferase
MSAAYDQRFYEWVNLTAQRSARSVLPLVKEQVRPASVLDVGCGQGAWLAVWSELGLVEGYGLDGDHVDKDALLIPREKFQAVDLRRPWGVGRRFDLVQSLEVAEHLPSAGAETFVKCLCMHGDVVLFSSAQPGQGGEGHVNERKPSYWARLFSANGYGAYDCIRPLIAGQKLIDPWYRFNTLLFANAAGAARLGVALQSSRSDELADLDRGGDALWHLRLALLRPLPGPAVTFLSRLRYRLSMSYHNKVGSGH